MRRFHPRLSTYEPGSTNVLLMVVQILFGVQGAARGIDYVFPRPSGPLAESLSEMESALPLPVWGIGFLIAGGCVLVGMYGGGPTMMVTGHALLAGLYGAFAYGLLVNAPIYSMTMAVSGACMLAVGIHYGIRRWLTKEWWRFALASVLTGVGGWVCGFGLGYNFRTATGLLLAGAVHAAFAIGVTYIASRAPGRKL